MVANLRSPRLSPTRRPGKYEEYHPYGSSAWWAGDAATVSRKRYRYTGRERDEEAGLQCHGVRYYAPWLGRWVSADPIGLGDGPNAYVYVHGNPVRGRDLRGLQEEVPDQAHSPPTDAIRGASVSGAVAEAFVAPAVEYWLGHTWQGAALHVLAESYPEQSQAVSKALDELSRSEVVLVLEYVPLAAGARSLILSATAGIRKAAAQGTKREALAELGREAVDATALPVRPGALAQLPAPEAAPSGYRYIYRGTGAPERPQVSKELRAQVAANPESAPAQGGTPDPFVLRQHVLGGESGLPDYVSAATDPGTALTYAPSGGGVVVYLIPQTYLDDFALSGFGETIFRDVVPEQFRLGVFYK